MSVTTITRVCVKTGRFVSVLKVVGSLSVGTLLMEVMFPSTGPRTLTASAESTQAILAPRVFVMGRA